MKKALKIFAMLLLLATAFSVAAIPAAAAPATNPLYLTNSEKGITTYGYVDGTAVKVASSSTSSKTFLGMNNTANGNNPGTFAVSADGKYLRLTNENNADHLGGYVDAGGPAAKTPYRYNILTSDYMVLDFSIASDKYLMPVYSYEEGGETKYVAVVTDLDGKTTYYNSSKAAGTIDYYTCDSVNTSIKSVSGLTFVKEAYAPAGIVTNKLAYVSYASDTFFMYVLSRLYDAAGGYTSISFQLCVVYLEAGDEGANEGRGWYLVDRYSSAMGTYMKLSDVAGEWNHVTIVYEVENTVNYGDLYDEEGNLVKAAHVGDYNANKVLEYQQRDAEGNILSYNYSYNISKSQVHIYLNGERRKTFTNFISTEFDNPASEKVADLTNFNFYTLRLQTYKQIDDNQDFAICFDDMALTYYDINYESVGYVGLDDVMENNYPLYATEDAVFGSNFASSNSTGLGVSATLYDAEGEFVADYELASGAYNDAKHNYRIETSSNALWYNPVDGHSFYVKYTGTGSFALSGEALYDIGEPDRDGWQYVTPKSSESFYTICWLDYSGGKYDYAYIEFNKSWDNPISVPSTLVFGDEQTAANKFKLYNGLVIASAENPLDPSLFATSYISEGYVLTEADIEAIKANSGILYLAPVYDEIEVAFTVTNLASGKIDVASGDSIRNWVDGSNLTNVINGRYNKGYKVTLHKDIDLNGSGENSICGTEANRLNNFVFDLNGCTLTKTDVDKSEAGAFGLYNGCKMTIISSKPGGVLEYTTTSSTAYPSLVYRAGSAAYNIDVDIGGFLGADGDNLTIKCVSLFNVRNYTTGKDAKYYAAFVGGDSQINIKGGTYDCTAGATTNAYGSVFSLNNCSIINLEDATFYTTRGFIYQNGTYTSGLHDSTVKNCKIYATKSNGEPATIVRLNAGFSGTTVDAVASALGYSEEKKATLQANFNERCRADITFEGCLLVGNLVHSVSDANAVTLGDGNLITNVKVVEGETSVDTTLAALLEADSTPIKLASGCIAVSSNVTVDGYTVLYATLNTASENLAVVIFGDAAPEYWYAGSALPVGADGEIVDGLYYLAFGGWQNEAGEAATVAEAGTHSYTAVYSYKLSVQGIKYSASVVGAEILINFHIPANALLTVDGVSTEITANGEDYAVYSLRVDAGSLCSVELVISALLTIEGEEVSLSETLTATLLQYAEDVMADANCTDTEKALVVNAVNYCHELYKFANLSSGDAEYIGFLTANSTYIKAFENSAEAVVIENAYFDQAMLYIGKGNVPHYAFHKIGEDTVTVMATQGENTVECRTTVIEGETYYIVAIDLNASSVIVSVADESVLVFSVAAYAKATEGTNVYGLVAALAGYVDSVNAYEDEQLPPATDDPTDGPVGGGETPEGGDPVVDPEEQPEGNEPENGGETTDPEQNPDGGEDQTGGDDPVVDPEQNPDGGEQTPGEEQIPGGEA